MERKREATIIIPVYNEEEAIGPTLEQMIEDRSEPGNGLTTYFDEGNIRYEGYDRPVLWRSYEDGKVYMLQRSKPRSTNRAEHPG